MAKKTTDLDEVREMALALPGVEESTMHGVPSWKVRGKLLACPALHRSAGPDSLVVRIDLADRERLVEEEPDVYYVTDHYLNHPMVLVRLSRIDRNSLKDLLGMVWRFANSPSKKARKKD
jgi:hypothetical protein